MTGLESLCVHFAPSAQLLKKPGSKDGGWEGVRALVGGGVT